MAEVAVPELELVVAMEQLPWDAPEPQFDESLGEVWEEE